MDSEKASLILNEKSLISNKNSLNYVKSFDVFQVPNTPDTSINLNTFQENLNDAIPELFDYYQSAFGSEEKHTISAFKSKIFSGPLRRLIQIAELSIDENLQPNNDSFWETFKGTFVVPEVYINGEKTYALVDSGASCSTISYKFANTETIRSLKLLFKGNTRIVNLANNSEVELMGQLKDLPVTVHDVTTTVNPHIMNDLSYDLILGREWCEANGVVIDFSKKKIYFLKPEIKQVYNDSMNNLNDESVSDQTKENEEEFENNENKSKEFNSQEYAQLENDISIKPYHEVLALVKSDQSDSKVLFVRSHDPLIIRFGIFTTKGICQFKSNQAYLVLANLTSEVVTLPAGTVVASLEAFNDEDYETHEWTGLSDEEKAEKEKKEKQQKFIINEPKPNEFLTWKPIIRRKQDLIIDRSKKLVKTLTVEVNHVDKREEDDDVIENKTQSPNEKEKEPYEQVKIDETNLTPEQLVQVKALLKSKAQAFAAKDAAPSKANNVTHTIDTGNHKPIHVPKYRVSHKERPIIEKHVQEMLHNKVIEPSKSPWSFPVVLEPKKDGTIRFCIDYRRLNDITIKDSYALPRIDSALAMLNGNQFFSSLDLAAGYFQIPMDEKDKEKTAFITDSGLYQFNVMAFGLTNGPATFQRYMDAVMAGLKWNILLIYIDDCLVFSKTFEDHLRDFESVLNRLIDANMTLKPSKCHLFQKEFLYLGHIVSAEGIRPDPKKIQAILEMPEPVDVTTVRSFLGMTGFYRNYIKNFSKICHPLYELTKNDVKFHMGEVERKSINDLKEAMTNAPILCHPNFDFPFIIETDAADKGLGAALIQRYHNKTHIIQFISRTLQPAEKKWHIREKEALGIIWACETFRYFIANDHFVVETDHESLKWLMKLEKPARLVRWAIKLSEYNFTIVPKAGKLNVTADALSRLPIVKSTFNIDSDTVDEKLVYESINSINITGLNPNEIKVAQKVDPVLSEIIKNCNLDSNKTFKDFTLKDDILYFYDTKAKAELLAIPFKLREYILNLYHNQKLSIVHMAGRRMIELFKKRFFWFNMVTDIQKWVRSCAKCVEHKRYQPKQHGLLQPIKSDFPFQMVGADIAGPFKRSTGGYKYILVIIDYFTNWVEAVPLRSLTAEDTAKAFFNLIISRHGCPNTIRIDRGTMFKSVFETLCNTFNIEIIRAPATHHQAQGKIERFIQFVKNSLATVTNSAMKNWDEMINNVLFVYRISFSRVLDDSPFFLLYGRDAIIPQDLALNLQSKKKLFDNTTEYKIELLKTLKKAYEKVRKVKDKEQTKYKEYFDKSHKGVDFKIGEKFGYIPKLQLLAKHSNSYPDLKDPTSFK